MGGFDLSGAQIIGGSCIGFEGFVLGCSLGWCFQPLFYFIDIVLYTYPYNSPIQI